MQTFRHDDRPIANDHGKAVDRDVCRYRRRCAHCKWAGTRPAYRRRSRLFDSARAGDLRLRNTPSRTTIFRSRTAT